MQAGTRVGPYEIAGRLGQGGMGEVYRARDTTLKRDVAIKVLPASVSGDPGRMARFSREAESLAALNHPNIAHIYSVDQSGDSPIIVMELVEGRTLGDVIQADGLPLDEALPIARQVAGALEAAHEKGIVHRDVKPANVMVTDDGAVKVLDFGLAKSVGSDGSPGAAESPTVTAQDTARGVILGTPAYMSPEQARGKSVDRRSDVWGFGCVLYEMLTGRRPFGGADATEMLASIIQGEPDWSALPAGIPPAVRTYLRRCLEKDPRRRVQSMGDVRLALDGAFDEAAPEARGATTATPMRSWTSWLPLTIAALVAGAGGTWALTRAEPPAPRWSAVPVVAGVDIATSSQRVVAVSPLDGTIAYSTAGSGIWLWRPHAVDPVDVPDTRGATQPTFSPDGRWLAYMRGRQLVKRRLPAVLSDDIDPATPVATLESSAQGVHWTTNGMFLVGAGEAGLLSVPDAGGLPSVVLAGRSGVFIRDPVLLPEGNRIVFSRLSNEEPGDATRLWVMPLSGGEPRDLGLNGRGVSYLPAGYLVYGRGTGLYAAQFDAATAEPVGDERFVHGGLSSFNQVFGAMQFALSPDGTLIYVDYPPVEGRMAVLAQDGSELGPVTDRDVTSPRYLRLSKDGSKLVFVSGPPRAGDVWLLPLDGGGPPFPLTDDSHQVSPVLSPDGRSIAFSSIRVRPESLFWMPIDASRPDPTMFYTADTRKFISEWTDRNTVIYTDITTEQADIREMRLDGTQVRPLVSDGGGNWGARLSPDGRLLAYESRSTGRVYLRDYEGAGAAIPVADGRTLDPVWSPDGSELYYLAGSGLSLELWAVEVLNDRGPTLGGRRQVADGILRLGWHMYDVHPDGRIFALLTPVDQSALRPNELRRASNWLRVLYERMAQ